MSFRHLLLLVLAFSLAVPLKATAQKIHIAFLWHMHQPIYYPGETIIETEDANHYDYSIYQIHTDRTGPYTNWPADAVQTGIDADFPHFGAQVSFSGTLIENLNFLEDDGVANFSNWDDDWIDIISQVTSLGNPRIDMIGFGYFHPLMGLIESSHISSQIELHRSIVLDQFAMDQYSRGIFPPENAFSARMIPGLISEGIEWVLVDNVHFDRACEGYPYNTGGNLYEPNGADIVNPDPGDWLQLNGLWAPTQVSAQWGHTPHRAKYIDPETGNESSIIVVPASRYIGNEDGRGGFGALQYDNVLSQLEDSNTDSLHPILVVLHHDGDNHGGGTDSYYNHNFDSFVDWLIDNDDRFECTTIQDYLDRFPPEENDYIHVEPGSWSGADNGDPEFLKWNGDPNEDGYSPDRNSWGIVTATQSIVATAQSIDPEIQATENAVRYLLNAEGSDYWYWDYAQGGIWDSHPARAANLAVEEVIETVINGDDEISPTIYLPQREPYNPGSTEWTMPQPSQYEVWTYVFDISGLESVSLMVREDLDGTNNLDNNHNETYAGGNDVGEWIEISMNGEFIESQTDPEPLYKSSRYSASVEDFTNTYLDYYVEATDSLGNTGRSPIQHVVVGDFGGGGDIFNMDGQLDENVDLLASDDNFELYAGYNGTQLYVAATSASILGDDVFILVTENPSENLVDAPWAKSGQTSPWDLFLGNESNNNWCGWTDQESEVYCASGSVVEGTIRVEEQWGDNINEIYLAAGRYATHDGGELTGQLPVGDGDGNIDADEFTLYELEYSRVENTSPTPRKFRLDNPYPNPFNSTTTISFTLPAAGRTSVRIYNIQGQLVTSLVDQNYLAGDHEVSWDADGYASGIYLVELKSPFGILNRKMMYIK